MKPSKYSPGAEVIIQPTPQSMPLFGRVHSVNYNQNFREYAYMVDLHSGAMSSAWESELRQSRKAAV